MTGGTQQRPLIYSGLLALAFSLVWVGRLLPGLLAEPLKLDLGLNDTQVGLLTGLSFGIVYALAVLPMARLADRMNRSFLIMVMLVLFGISTIAIGMVYSFLLIVILRLIVGACEAAMFPASISLVADSYSEERRHLAMTVYTSGIVVGLSLLVAAVGYFEQWNGWRGAFIMVGVSGVVVGLLVKLLFRDTRTPGAGHNQPPVIPVIKSLFRNPAFVHLTLGMTLYLVVDNVALGWTPAFLARSHERDPQWTSNFIAVGAGLLNGAVVLASGPLLSRLRQPAVILYILMGLFTGLFVIGFLVSNLWFASFVLACGMGLSGTITAILLSTIQSLAPANARATASALVLAPGVLFGAGGGPQITGFLSDLLTPRFGAEALRYSILIIISIAGIWACVHFMALLKAIRKKTEAAGIAPN